MQGKSIKQIYMELKNKTISEIASIINSDWKKVNYAAAPYLNAMYSLETINDNYGYDSAKSIVLYFLSNASSWKGETAKVIKAHLKSITK